MKKNIHYPFENIPASLELIKIATNLFWLRMPMPFTLNHINLWLIEDQDGWTIIDSGLNFDKSKDYWQHVIKHKLKNKPIKQVICTHMHPDHIGLSGWLCEHFDAELWMSQGEFEGYHTLNNELVNNNYTPAHAFYLSCGATIEQAKLYDKYIGMYTKFVYPFPTSYRRLIANEVIKLGGVDWHIIIGSGHSPEHVCLWCKSLDIIISGDQILPTISSNISVHPQEPFTNPLNNWLTSCLHFKALLNNETLVLPAHGKPFTGVIKRLDELINDVEYNLKKLTKFCETPKRVTDAFEVLFYNKVNQKTFMLACGESKAHFNYLTQLNILDKYYDEKNVAWYYAKD